MSTGRLKLEELKRQYVLEVVQQTRGSTADAARILGIDRRTLNTRLRRYLSGEPEESYGG